MRIDDAGIRLPGDLEDRLGLEIGGRQVWAFAPTRDGRRTDEGRLVPWPGRLVPYLNGRADVLVRSLETQEVLFQDTLTFGDGQGVVELVDAQGRPLTVAKNNRMSAAMFGDASAQERGIVADTVAESLEFLRERGHEAFLAFGNLLGAVRDGRLIGHDNDADIAYLAKSSHPADVILESMRVEREFADAGWDTFRANGASFKVFSTLPDGRRIGIDVFSAFYFQDQLHVLTYLVAPLPREALLPTSTVTLEGREVAAPAQPETVLEATYGPNWRVPDPTFKYETPRQVRRRINGLFGGERRHSRHWEDFYATRAGEVPAEPTSFARWVAGHEHRPTSLLDLGSGTGRDAVWFAEQGVSVLGCDYSQLALRYAEERAAEQGSSATFRPLDLYDLRQALAVGALLGREAGVDAVYARFFVDALEDGGRRNLWRFSRSVLSGTRGRVFLEFRTEATEHTFGAHYRNFVPPEVACSELEFYGFRIEHCEDGHGLAVLREEDPRVCRIIARLEG